MIVIFQGLVWVYSVRGGWYRHLRCFPSAKDTSDPEVINYARSIA